MSGQHTPEPWCAHTDGRVEHNNVTHFVTDAGAGLITYGHLSEANARRIVACVNACAGFSDDELREVAANGGFIDQTRYNAKVTAQRDQLLSALKGMVEVARLTIGWHCTPPGANGPLVVAEQTIASAEAQL